MSCLPKGRRGEGRRHRLREAIPERLHALGEPVGPTAEPVFRAPARCIAGILGLRARSVVAEHGVELRVEIALLFVELGELAFELRELLLRLTGVGRLL